MTKQEEINQLIKIVCPHLECEDGEPSITLGGFEAIQDFYAARIKERDERMMKTARDSGNNQIQRELEARCALTREDVEKLIYTVRFVADRDSSSEGLKDIYFLRDKLQAILDAMGGNNE